MTPPTSTRRLAAVLLATAVAAACSPGAGTSTAPLPDAATAGGSAVPSDRRLIMSPRAAVIVSDFDDPRQMGRRDPLHVRGARVDGDSLRVEVETGGGCAQHLFRLGVSHTFMESDPVQVRAALGHDAKGDMCRALLREELSVSLAPLAAAWRASYRQQSGTVIIHLEGWSEPLRYTF